MDGFSSVGAQMDAIKLAVVGTVDFTILEKLANAVNNCVEAIQDL